MPTPTKFGRVETYLEGILPTKLLDLWSSDKLNLLYLHYQSVYGLQAWQGGDLRWGILIQKITYFWSRGLARSCDKLKPLYPQYYKVMTNKLGRVVGQNEELQLLLPYHCWITCSCEVTWHIRFAISPLALDQWTLSMARYWLTVRGFHPWSHMTI